MTFRNQKYYSYSSLSFTLPQSLKLLPLICLNGCWTTYKLYLRYCQKRPSSSDCMLLARSNACCIRRGVDWRKKRSKTQHNGFTCNDLVFIPRFRWMDLLKYTHLAKESDLCQTHADVFSNHFQDPSWEMIGKCLILWIIIHHFALFQYGSQRKQQVRYLLNLSAKCSKKY